MKTYTWEEYQQTFCPPPPKMLEDELQEILDELHEKYIAAVKEALDSPVPSKQKVTSGHDAD